MVEQVASSHDWLFERSAIDIAVKVMDTGATAACSCLACRCACPVIRLRYDMRVPEKNRAIAAAFHHRNVSSWAISICGRTTDCPFFGIAITRGAGVSREQLEDVVDIAFTESERYYPAFQFLIWGGKSPKEAMAAAILETEGEA